MLTEFTIGDRMIGDGHPNFIIAEVGSNHNQDWDLALKHIDAAAAAGVDAVKFQTFDAKQHVSKYAEMPSYLTETRTLQDLIGTLELDRDWQKPLMEYCAEKGVIFFSSPCDHAAVEGLEAIGAPAHKIASFDLPDLGLVRHIARTGKPVILSTGCTDWGEIQRAVDVCREEGNERIVLLQCTSLYPAPSSLSNLRAMGVMRQAYHTLVGYSDHTIGDTVSIVSSVLGGCMIEKHFTLDRTLPGPDHNFAMEPAEFSLLVERVREAESAMGDGVKNGPRPEEQEMADKVRRSIHAATDIAAGTVITDDMLCVKRPGAGIAPHMRNVVVGRTARKAIATDHWISWDMI